MILLKRLISHSRSWLFAAFVFVLGLGVGVGIAPVTAARNEADAEPSPSTRGERIRVAHRAEVLRVIDGDTFEARVHLWPGLNITTRVRLRGIDAPEFKARCLDERTKAAEAREALQSILDQGEVTIARVMLDKFGGRVLADASTNATPDIAASLLAAGHARRYSGARREAWCR